ncbi:MAG: hypothetical protein WA133_07740 [Syntrophales bacterium]
MDSFSLYNRSGFIPRAVHHDMAINVSGDYQDVPAAGRGCVRDAALDDVADMGNLEMEVSSMKHAAAVGCLVK